MSQLKIGIDVHSIGSRKGGNETYYKELVSSLAQTPCVHKFLLYHTTSSVTKEVRAAENFIFRRICPSHPVIRIPCTLPWHIRTDRLDLFHAQFIVPPFLRCPTVTTIPDIAYEHFPEFFPATQRLWLKTLIPESAVRADHIITVSEYSKRDLIETYGLPEDKITVTYEGAGDKFVPLNKEKCREELDRSYGINGEFILYLGRLQARKNLLRLVEAYARIRKCGFHHKLVLAGKRDSLFDSVLLRVRELELEDEVLLPGYIAPEHIVKLYSAAEVFVYPSFFEGFGLPIMEAMACGTPVITSRSSSLEEIAGGSAVLVEPEDELSIANALMTVLNNATLRCQLGKAGLERSRLFNFKSAAQKTIEVYERVMGKA